MAPREAGIAGTREIFLAVISTTITLAIVFLPLLFMGGLPGRLFREFGVTIAGAVMISALVALTLTPMLSSRLLRQTTGTWLAVPQDRAVLHVAGAQLFRPRSPAFLRAPWIALGVLVGAGVLIYFLLGHLPRELSPIEDRARLWVRARAPDGVSYDYMQNVMNELSAATAERLPEAEIMMTQVPPAARPGHADADEQCVRARVPERHREIANGSQAPDIARGAARSLQRQFPELRLNITQEASIGEKRANETGLQLVLEAPELDDLRDGLPRFWTRSARASVFSVRRQRPQVQQAGSARALRPRQGAGVGVSALDIAQTLQTSLSGQRVRIFHLQGQAVRRDRPAHAGLSLAPDGCRQPRGPHGRRRRPRAARQPRRIRREQLAARAVSLQPPRGGDDLRHARQRHDDERRHRRLRAGGARRSTSASRRPLRAPRATTSRARPRSAGCSCSRWRSSISCWPLSSRASRIPSSFF